MTKVMRKGMPLHKFLEEAVRCDVPGLPFVDAQDQIVGRVSIRDVFKRIAVPSSYLRLADAMGDETDRLDMSEERALKRLARPVENYLLEKVPTVSRRSSLVKALAIMEAHNTHYIFLIEDGTYMGVVTRMVIAKRLLEWFHAVHKSNSVPDA